MGDTRHEQPALPPDPPRDGTLWISIQNRAYGIRLSQPPPSTSIDELIQALERNRQLIGNSQQRMQAACQEKYREPDPGRLPPVIDLESPTQDALMAHLHIQILIPLINIRGGEASFNRAETLSAQDRVEQMRRLAELQARPVPPPLDTQQETVILIGVILLALLLATLLL
ncbi:MAG: hypothetical protein KDI15_12980 [Thiothrix sp.]|nr:hypothetical protein [Thiothrix sp.]HPE61134.1 hypothetical protein [Thiolinea sp.]